jgi:hypothetical protein
MKSMIFFLLSAGLLGATFGGEKEEKCRAKKLENGSPASS